MKLTLRLDARIHAAIQAKGRAQGSEICEHIQRILAEHAINQELLDEATGLEYEMKESLVDRAVQTAVRIIQDGGFATNITHKAILECMADKQWAEDYEAFVGDNPQQKWKSAQR